MDHLTSAIEPDFEKAGWFPGRRVDVASWVPPHHPAHSVLQSFSGLRVGTVGAGEDCASSDIEFGRYYFDDDDYWLCFEDELGDWQKLLKTEFVCLGECHNAHGQVWMDSEQRIFQYGLVAPMMMFEGYTFASGVERLLRGRRSQPMLLPWQPAVTVWGETFNANDPRVLSPNFFNGI